MKTIETKVYQFQELGKEAKKNALNNLRESMEERGYFWDQDAIKSLKKFAEHFGGELKDYSIDFLCPSQSSADFYAPEDISAKELKELILSMGSFNKKTLKGLGDCKFTGVCFDEDAADGARKAFFDGERDLNKILQNGFKFWMSSTNQDYEYQLSDKGLIEDLESNDREFTEDGEIY